MTCHANDILLVKLQKKQTPTDNARFTDSSYQYEALGYYDYVGFSFVSDPEQLAKESANGMVGGEHSILIPVTERLITFDSHPMGILSYFMVDEKTDTELICLAQDIESQMGESCKSYITMGASAIAILCLYSDVEHVVEKSRQHIMLLQGHSQEWKDVMYTFSITFFSHVVEQHLCEKIHSVYISFAWKAGLADCASSFLAAVGTELCPRDYKTGIMPGTDDYFIHAIDVPFNNFMHLYGKNGILASERRAEGLWYGSYCDSTYTVIGYALQDEEGDYPPCETSMDTEENDSYHIVTVKKRLEKYKDTGTINSLLDSIESFRSLNNSKYTAWVYKYYLSVVELFISLIDDELSQSGDVRRVQDGETIAEISKESTCFFDILEKMLGSLLNTSAYLTNSPGYRTIERNYIPRLLLCYQNIINTLVMCWDAAYPKPLIERKHAFVLCVQDGAEPQAYMHFSQLPPDKRVISIMIPLRQAYQPAMLLPLLLHEAGHYIGVRHRSNLQNSNKSRDNYFISLVARMFIRELLEFMFGIECSKLARCFSAPLDFISNNIDEIDDDPQEYVAEVIHSILALYEYCDFWTRHIAEEYNAYKRNFLNKHSGALNTEMGKRKKYAIEANYFSEMRTMMHVVINDLLVEGEVEFYRIFERHIKLCIEQAPTKKEFFNKILAGIISRTSDALKKCLIHLAENDGMDFLSKSEGILSEIAADMFMTYGVHMSPMQYLCITFEQYARKKIPLAEITVRFSQTSTAHIRVIAVYSALVVAGYQYKTNCYVDESMKRIAQLYEVETQQVKVVFDDFVHWIREMYQENETADDSSWTVQLERMLSPIHLACSYAKAIIQDERYAHFFDQPYSGTEAQKKLNRVFDRIRAIYDKSCNIGDDRVSLSDCYRLLYDKVQ